jgi:hypothetical protein
VQQNATSASLAHHFQRVMMSSTESSSRVGKNKYVMVESYRSEQERFNLQCWALTAESFLDAEEWVWLYHHCAPARLAN